MKTAILAMAMGGALLSVTPATVWAHHSHSMFDTSKNVTATGTVRAYDFTNPHIHIYLMVQDMTVKDKKTGAVQVQKTGSVVLFTVEAPAPGGQMARQGIERSTFKPGDVVTVSVEPFRDGQLGGYFNGAIDAKGVKHGSLAGRAVTED